MSDLGEKKQVEVQPDAGTDAKKESFLSLYESFTRLELINMVPHNFSYTICK